MKNIFDNIEINDNYIFFHKYGNGWSSTSRWEIYDFMLFVTVAALLAALLVWCVVSYIKHLNKRNKAAEALDAPVTLPKIKAVTAKVVAKDCELLKFGSKSQSRHKVIYWAEFLTNDGQTVKHEITEDIFDSIVLHQEGTLATTDGKFFYFDDGENITQ